MLSYAKINIRQYILLATLLLWLTRTATAAPLLQGQDLAVITNPSPNSSVQGVVNIQGSADYPSFQFYVIEAAPFQTEGWQFVGEGQTAVIDGTLATWDTSSVPDGPYSLRMRVVRLDGNYSEIFVQQITVSNSQPIPTDTPTPAPELELELIPDPDATLPESEFALPTPTPEGTETPTPEVEIDQPIIETPTPRPTETPSIVLEPTVVNLFQIPEVRGFSVGLLQDAFVYGMIGMLSLFLLFGFLSAVRLLFLGFYQRRRGRKSRFRRKA